MDTNHASTSKQSQIVAEATKPFDDLADPTHKYMLIKITQQEYLADLKYKIKAISQTIQQTREETKAELVIQEKLIREHARWDKQQAEAVAKCDLIGQQVEQSMKVLNDCIKSEVSNDARTTARQNRLEKQLDEINELKRKLEDIQAKSKQHTENIVNDDNMPSSQKPINKAADVFFEAETRLKTAQLNMQNIQQKLVDNKSEIAALQDFIKSQREQLTDQQTQRTTHSTTLAEINQKIDALELQTTQMKDELAKHRQHGQELHEQVDQLHNERIQSRSSVQTEIDEVNQQVQKLQSDLLPETVRDKVQNVQNLLERLTDKSLSGESIARRICSEMDITIPETEENLNDVQPGEEVATSNAN